MSTGTCHLCSPPAHLEGEAHITAVIADHMRVVHPDRTEAIGLQLLPDGSVDVDDTTFNPDDLLP